MPLVIIIVGFSLANAMAAKCLSAWAHLGADLCLKQAEYFSQVPFENALHSCGKQNATVAYPRTPLELDSLRNFTKSLVEELRSSTQNVWLNVDDRSNEGRFRSAGHDARFLEWDTGEPLNNVMKNCVVLDLMTAKLKMVECSSKASFVCQLPSAACIEGYESIGSRCLKFITNDEMTAVDANITCTNAMGKLPIPKSFADIQLYNYFWNTRKAVSNIRINFLLGISYYLNQWRIMYSSATVATYLDWLPGEPNNMGNEHCVENTGMQMNNIVCTPAMFSFFCESEATSSYWSVPLKNGFITHNITANSVEFVCQPGFILRGNEKSYFDVAKLQYVPSIPPICDGKTEQRAWLSKKRKTIRRGLESPFSTIAGSSTQCVWNCEESVQRVVLYMIGFFMSMT